MEYTFDFQVWRPSQTVNSTGCYSLVGNNRFTQVPLSGNTAVVTPTPSIHGIVQFRPGDVLGFYVEQARDENGGVVLLNDASYTDIVVWHASIDVAAASSQTGNCPYSVGPNRVLDTSTTAAPVISVSLCKLFFIGLYSC